MAYRYSSSRADRGTPVSLMRVRSQLMSAGKLGKGLLGAAFIVIGVAIVSGVDKSRSATFVARFRR